MTEREHLDERTLEHAITPAEAHELHARGLGSESSGESILEALREIRSTLTRVELTPHDMMTLPAAEIRARQQLLADVTTHGDSVRVWFCVECRWTGTDEEACRITGSPGAGIRCPRCEVSGLHWARVRALEASVLGFR